MAFFVFLLLLVAAAFHVVGQQPGFLSIDCGLDDKSSGYTDPHRGIFYVSDGVYVDAGENVKVAADYKRRQWVRSYLTARSFPSGERNCYALPTVAGAKYMVRLVFVYGNHDGRNDSSSLEFDLHLGPNYWDTVRFGFIVVVYEGVFLAWASWAPVCLVNTGHGTPFLSVLELRPLGDAFYPPVGANQSLSMYRRLDIGAIVEARQRFPIDPYDRYWSRGMDSEWLNISTTSTIQPDPDFMEPVPVLQTAATSVGNETALNFAWEDYRETKYFMVFLHFADFQNTLSRQFDIYFNDNRLRFEEKAYSPPYLAASCIYNSKWYRATNGKYNVTLSATADSVLPPILNALEIYTRIALDTPSTFAKDFDAIMAIKFEYGVKKHWMGDPCFPTKYACEGVKCINTTHKTMRITTLNLSNSDLHGVISKNFTSLTALEHLDLSYNNLSGSIPDSLPSLPTLRILNLSGNHLSGHSLCKNYTGLLIFRDESNRHTCNDITNPSKTRVAAIIATSVVAVLVVVVLLACFIWKKKRKTSVSAHNQARYPQVKKAKESRKMIGGHLQNTECFTYKELEKFTDNFKRFIGQGGFGPVYYGRLDDGTEVAVKMRSDSSSHGLDEFLAEVQSLTKVYHRTLVCLVGYCWDKHHLALVYEYMSQGTLCEHMRGTTGVDQTLNWRTRVCILLEAAQGLDYLHKGCNLPIIHRDVKTSNILLGQNLQAKIGDFGLSKTYVTETQTHISTSAAGSAGYIDPEYHYTGRLSESSDVYSFGVVLLEVATGEPPILLGEGHIVHRVKQKIVNGDIGLVVDARLRGVYDVTSMWKVIDTAMMCTVQDIGLRPTMAFVVVQLKECLALEDARQDSGVRTIPGTDTTTLVSIAGPSVR